jgi:L-asparaginase
MNYQRAHKLAVMIAVLFSAVSGPVVVAQERPLIRVVATGGTIAHLGNNNRLPFEEVIADIHQRFPETHPLLDSVRIEVDNTLTTGSGGLTGDNVLQIARAVQKAVADPEVQGVIVTHGTTTSDETAYYLHLLIRTDKPVVLTNSQRLHGIVGNDGDRNFIESIEVVLSREAAGKGVLLVHNSSISSAREVTKGSYRPGGFQSGEFGLMGIIGAETALRARERTPVVSFYRAPTRRHTSRSEFDLDSITELPRVEILVAHRDAEGSLAQVAIDKGARGIVILGTTAFGRPNRSQTAVMEALAKKGIPIVLTTRGGVNNWIEGSSEPFISGDNLPMQKAKILLELALTRTTDFAEIQRMFNEY